MSDDKTEKTLYDGLADRLGRLRLPRVEVSVRSSRTTKDYDIYDPLRRQWVALTPEEWVRQHFVDFLVRGRGVSPFRIANEIALTLNGTSRRADTVVYDDSLKPYAVVEYKAASIALTAAVLDQALRYNLVFNAPYVVITNGLDVYTVVDGSALRGLPDIF